MHIQRQNSMELVLQDGSMWLAFIFVPAAIAIAVSSVEKHKPWGLFGAAFFLLFAALFTRHTTFTLDGMQRVARWRCRALLKVSSGSIPFDAIQDIVIDAQAGPRNNSMTYRLSILTATGPTPMANIFEGGTIEHFQKLREQILDFIGLKPAADRAGSNSTTSFVPADLDASLRSLLAQGRTIDAISLLRSHHNISLTEAKSRIDALAAQMQAQK